MSQKKFRSSANFPAWFDGTNLSEPLFCTAFLRNHQLIYSEGSFFTPNGRMQDCTPLKEPVFQEIHPYIRSGVPNKIKNIIEMLSGKPDNISMRISRSNTRPARNPHLP